ncbi:MAG: helix-turn-helix domain-containing protein [Pedobacter sp.]|uniref:helix-turn-helix domain-containing protein n=1 Tax=Pedobacter sp. TaxID=1411316 RepID=UPI003569C231
MKDLIDINTLKVYLKVSRQTISRMLQEEIIPSYRVRGQWRFDMAEIDKWLEESKGTKNGI